MLRLHLAICLVALMGFTPGSAQDGTAEERVAEGCEELAGRLESLCDKIQHGRLTDQEIDLELLDCFSRADELVMNAGIGPGSDAGVGVSERLLKSLKLLRIASAEFYLGFVESNGLLVQEGDRHLRLSQWWLGRWKERSAGLACLEFVGPEEPARAP